MPHSTVQDVVVSPSESEVDDQDSVLPDAPPLPSDDVDNLSQNPSHSPPANGTSNADVKLEDLFNDDDSQDEEFPSSSVLDDEPKSSPPAQIVYTCFFRRSLP